MEPNRTSAWFEGLEGRSEYERSFLHALRTTAAGSDWHLTPEDTWSMPGGVPLYLAVDIPAMRTFPGQHAARQWEIALWPSDSHRGLRLEGNWGDAQRPMDSIAVLERGILDVVGVAAQPEELAVYTVQWLREQSTRLLRFRFWKTGAATVKTEDTKDQLGVHAPPWRRVGSASAQRLVRAYEDTDANWQT